MELFIELDGGPSTDTAAFKSACRSAFASHFAAGACVAWLARAPNEPGPVGNIVLLRFPRLPTPKNLAAAEGYIINVLVTPAWRNRGVASALVKAAIDYAKKSGLGRIRLHTTAAGRAVYAKLGFVARDNEMELDLGA